MTTNNDVRQILPSSLPVLGALVWTEIEEKRKIGVYGEYVSHYTLTFTTKAGNKASLDLRPKDEMLGNFLALRVEKDLPISLSFEKTRDGRILVLPSLS
jgi:hypothetical protein